MELKLSTPIAEGRTAEIYEWNEGQILKLYHAWCPPHWVEDESKVARAIHEAGIPSPAVGEIVEVNQRRGLVYERLIGNSMLQEMTARPWTFRKHARSLAELQSQINQLSIPELPSYHEGLMYTVQRAPHLDEDLRSKTLERLSTLDDGDRVCHGDFHPGNVLLTNRGPIVIDWMTARRGNPWADVARTNLLLSIGAKSAGKQVKPIIRWLVDSYRRMYLDHYSRLNPGHQDEVRRWMPIIAAARLDEQIERERDALPAMVRDGLVG
jgi:tRNA A-37 threonylcarbamoyl transferase component Bud32